MEPIMFKEVAEITSEAPVSPSEPRFYSYADVAKIFSRTPRTVRWWVKSGRLKAIKIGCARYIPDTEIYALKGQPEGES
ncbi:MAG: hypothetical protein B7Z80_13675 [Rhodospirillales bacterium 20-64-7]|nr:MAG: hypothetical protein B7Z80_13675 [Rhodospirillales bacterium 20-64-7]